MWDSKPWMHPTLGSRLRHQLSLSLLLVRRPQYFRGFIVHATVRGAARRPDQEPSPFVEAKEESEFLAEVA